MAYDNGHFESTYSAGAPSQESCPQEKVPGKAVEVSTEFQLGIQVECDPASLQDNQPNMGGPNAP